MKIRFLKFFSIVMLMTLPACEQMGKVTYSEKGVEQSVIELCKKEYDLDVDVRIIGNTLGVYIPVEGLVDKKLRLDPDAGKKIENVALSIHRVTMSTDRPLKFYALTARDIKTTGAEFILIGHVYDVVRVRLLDISRGEYHKRIIRDFKFNPVVAGLEEIKKLMANLNKNPKFVQGLEDIFYPIYEIGIKNSQKIELSSVMAKEISENEGLFYINTKEYYEPLPNFEVYRAIFPPGFTNEYLILVDVSKMPDPIREIVPKYFYSGTEIRQRDLGKSFAQYKDIGYIGIDGFPKHDIDTNWFLSEQISRRIPVLFQEDKDLRDNYSLKNSVGLWDRGVFRFRFSVEPNEASYIDEALVFSRIFDMAGYVLRRYSFDDFKGVELIGAMPYEKRLYLTAEELGSFPKHKSDIKKLLDK